MFLKTKKLILTGVFKKYVCHFDSSAEGRRRLNIVILFVVGGEILRLLLKDFSSQHQNVIQYESGFEMTLTYF